MRSYILVIIYNIFKYILRNEHGKKIKTGLYTQTSERRTLFLSYNSFIISLNLMFTMTAQVKRWLQCIITVHDTSPSILWYCVGGNLAYAMYSIL